ncbi:hypothetical protein BR63_06930 [Thermanaerosceptrum fracticalcis]|uniref:Inositol monophosphatase n=2 Tax=Thermanaerosceptrum fracticalcis TaxID=1712410 RepID=A0A7G6E1W7_THEFR|nr:hypothetical protein BR63_06930 [Thermanaerosceptrum fracticalcis]
MADCIIRDGMVKRVDKHFYFRYGRDLIEKINRVVREEMKSPQCSLFFKHDCLNVSGDVPTGFDEIINRTVLNFVHERKEVFPVILVSEETGVDVIGDNPRHFMLVDPIDGSNNVRPWLTPSPVLSVSIAFGKLADLEITGNHRALEFTMQKEIFADKWYYSSDDCSYYQSEGEELKLRTSPLTKLYKKAVIGIDLDVQSSTPINQLNLLTSELVLRRAGSSILDLCQVASGQYDAYVSLGRRLKVTDVCQPFHLVQCAGGDFQMKVYLNGQTNTGLHDTFLYDIIKTREVSLLNKLKFNVIAAGTPELGRELARLTGF